MSPAIRQQLAIEVLAKPKPISYQAVENGVSHKFLQQQGQKAEEALSECFAAKTSDQEILFLLPVTKNWLAQLMLGPILICHSSYRGVLELFDALFDLQIGMSTIHNRLQSAANSASQFNETQQLSGIEVGL